MSCAMRLFSRVFARPVAAALRSAAAALLFASCGLSADGPLPAGPGAPHAFGEVFDRGAGTIRVLWVASPGFAYGDAEGRPTGVTVELMREFGRYVEGTYGVALTVEFEDEPDWRTFYARVRGGEPGLFGVGNVTITEARRAEIGFSPPYLHNVAVLITHADVPELESLEQLGRRFAGLRPLAFGGTLHESRLAALRDAHLPDLPIETAASNAEILERVAAERSWFAYIDGYNFWRAVAAGAPLRRHAIADDPGETFGVIFPLASDWGPAIDAFFAAEGGLLERPFYRALLVEHLGEGLAATLDEARQR
jgi:ABC-type amino acid transport substrate-binding protein